MAVYSQSSGQGVAKLLLVVVLTVQAAKVFAEGTTTLGDLNDESVDDQRSNSTICEDISTECAKWAAKGKCSRGNVYWRCKATCACGTESNPCEDTHHKCQRWASEGKCGTERVFKKCRSSCPCVSAIPGGFEMFHGRVIRRPNTNDSRSLNYDQGMAFCDQFGAEPFIPRTEEDYQLYKDVRTSLGPRGSTAGDMWLPANDVLEEGTLRWVNGEVVSNISLWDWPGRGTIYYTELHNNNDSNDYLKYGCCGSGDSPFVVFIVANTERHYPPICEII